MDGQAIAFEYGFNLDGRFEDWRTGFDLTHSELAGGTLLLYYLLKQLYSDGHYDLDFLCGEYDFKEKWLQERVSSPNYASSSHIASLPGWR